MDWQSILTAPMDRTEVLIWDGRINVAHWSEVYDAWLIKHDDGHETPFPTHWMPLPEPPAKPVSIKPSVVSLIYSNIAGHLVK